MPSAMKRPEPSTAGPSALAELRASIEDAGRRPRVICFDYFDTLVYRNVYPEATKKLAAAQLSVALGQRLSGETLYQLRHELEATLCREKARITVGLARDRFLGFLLLNLSFSHFFFYVSATII